MELEAMDVGLARQVDQLEAVLDAGWHMPATGRVLIDRTAMLELIDRMRVAIPEQVRAAEQVLQRREQILTTAKAEADSILAEARHQARRRLAEEVSLQAAAQHAAHIEAQAWRTAEALERHTDQAAAEWLQSLHVRLEEVDRMLAQPLSAPARANEPSSRRGRNLEQPLGVRNVKKVA